MNPEWKLINALQALLRSGNKQPRRRQKPRKYRPRCGAKTRNGTPCNAPVVWDKRWNRPKNGRCKLHGGLSTGPKTTEGKARIAQSNRERSKQAMQNP